MALDDYGKDNPYVRLGDALEIVVRGLLDETSLESPSERTTIPNYVYALLTYFQFLEQVTDEQMVDMVRKRADLRCAVRWHLGFPNIPPSTLCEFRRWLFANPSYQDTFITLASRSARLLLPEAPPDLPGITDILRSICAVTRVEKLKDQMLLTLESLTARLPDWVLSIAPPHWYDRYSRSPKNIFIANARKDWLALLPEIEQDMKILLDAVAANQDRNLAETPEIEKLRALWEEQFADPQKRECLLCSHPKP